MAVLFRPNTFIKQLRSLRTAIHGSSVPTFDLNTERKAFLDVLPEVINSVLTGPKLTDIPEIGSWMKKLLEYMLGRGKLGRGLMVSVGYRMFEEPEHFSEETQHSARVLGWCMEMLRSLRTAIHGSSVPTFDLNTERKAFLDVLPEVINSVLTGPKLTDIPEIGSWMKKLQIQFLIMDDIVDGATSRYGQPCWHLQSNVGVSAIKDSLLIYQSIMELLDIYFGQTPTYTELLRQFNETVYKSVMGEHLDLWSSYKKENNNFHLLNTDRIYKALAINKTAYYCYKLPIFAPLLLVKNGKQKATKELHNICMDFGRLMQCQDDYLDAYGNEIITGKTGRDIQEGKCSWVAVTALQHCNDAQRAIFKEYYGSKDPEHVKRIKQLYDELHVPQLYEQCERTFYEDIMRRINVLPNEADRIFLLEVLNANYKRVY